MASTHDAINCSTDKLTREWIFNAIYANNLASFVPALDVAHNITIGIYRATYTAKAKVRDELSKVNINE